MLSVITYDDMFMKFTQQFLQNFEEIASSDFQAGTYLDFKIEGRDNKKRINPIIKKATIQDIDEIIFIYQDVYDKTYPYKEMEDRDEIFKMLHSPNVEWLIFETKEGEIVGCFTFLLDFEKKLGNIRGFNLKKKFLGKLDIMKMAMGSIIAMYKKYNDKIFRWYGECRTAHSKSQFFLSALGFKPVGFYPCKDVFYNKVESDILILSYDQRTLTTLRSTETPAILPEALNGFLYSDRRYDLGSCKIAGSNTTDLHLDRKKIKDLQKKLQRNISKDRFGYESIQLTFKGFNSFFEFLYTPTVQNFEKTYYKVDSLEELSVFVEEFIKYGRIYNVRYCEAFISAYKPTHQQIFLNFGLRARGYVPSWHYNKKTGKFEDCILFNWYEGEINNIYLLEEGQELLNMLDMQYSYEPRIVQKREPHTMTADISKMNTKIHNLNWSKVFTSSTIIGMTLYMILLFISLGVATGGGYSISIHTISELSLSSIPSVPLLFEISCILGGLNSMLFYYLLSNKCKKTKKYIPLSYVGMISGMIGSIGIVFVGVFSLDRSDGIIHGIFSVLAFGGFILSIAIFSLRIWHCPMKISKMFLVTGVLPILSTILYFTLLTPLYEWLMLLSIIFSILPLFWWTTYK
ncbi:MAG: DUF998 domain-containing protein [Candidatus Hodarchaeota archaeon]